MDVQEREAIARLKQGEVSGLQVLVERYQYRAVGAAYLITLDRALAEDIVQEAFLRVYHRIGQYDPDRPFAPWFLRGVVNDSLKAAARLRHDVPEHALDSLPDSHAVNPLDLVEANETNAAIAQAVMALPTPQRAAVVLHYYLDLSEAEIAREMACPPGTVKWRLHAAKQQLRRLLDWIKP